MIFIQRIRIQLQQAIHTLPKQVNRPANEAMRRSGTTDLNDTRDSDKLLVSDELGMKQDLLTGISCLS